MFQKLPEKLRNGYKDKQHLSDIHLIPCSNCFTKGREQTTKTIAHHKIGMGIGKKASDLLTCSLCDSCHTGNEGIHNIPLNRWEEENLTQDELIIITNQMISKL